jgi:hypothetical protein
VEHAAEVRLEHDAPVLVGHPRDEAVPREPGVVDENVQVAGLGDQASGLIGIGDVRLSGTAPELACNRLGLVPPGAVADDDLRTRARELARDRTADPSRSAGDKGELTVEPGKSVMFRQL